MTGRLTIEAEGSVIDEDDLPARQGRLTFAYLALNRSRRVPRSELATAVWGEDTPDGWENTLSSLLSRLRRLLPAQIALDTLGGAVRLRLPPETWIDLEALGSALDEAEGHMRHGRPQAAWPAACIAVVIGERGFLPGEDDDWAVAERRRLSDQHIRALECLADVSLALNEPSAALRYAQQCIQQAPFRESGYARAMRAHTSSGNRAEALRVYEALRRLLAEELGTDPSPAVEAAYLEALR